MKNYFIAFSRLSHDISEPLGAWAECMGYYSLVGLAKLRAQELSNVGYKNVIVFWHDGYDPYDKVMTHCVSWDYVMKNKVYECSINN